jgi:hypothetical protein
MANPCLLTPFYGFFENVIHGRRNSTEKKSSGKGRKNKIDFVYRVERAIASKDGLVFGSG